VTIVGSLVGWPPVIDQILTLDFDTVVPSTGPLVGRQELETLRTGIQTVISRATALVKRGVPKDQLLGPLEADGVG